MSVAHRLSFGVHRTWQELARNVKKNEKSIELAYSDELGSLEGSRPNKRQLEPGEVGEVHVTVGIIVGAGAARIGRSPRPGQAHYRPFWGRSCHTWA